MWEKDEIEKKEEKKYIETYFKLFRETSEVNAPEIAVVKYPEGPPEGNTVSRCDAEQETHKSDP